MCVYRPCVLKHRFQGSEDNPGSFVLFLSMCSQELSLGLCDKRLHLPVQISPFAGEALTQSSIFNLSYKEIQFESCKNTIFQPGQ